MRRNNRATPGNVAHGAPTRVGIESNGVPLWPSLERALRRAPERYLSSTMLSIFLDYDLFDSWLRRHRSAASVAIGGCCRRGERYHAARLVDGLFRIRDQPHQAFLNRMSQVIRSPPKVEAEPTEAECSRRAKPRCATFPVSILPSTGRRTEPIGLPGLPSLPGLAASDGLRSSASSAGCARWPNSKARSCPELASTLQSASWSGMLRGGQPGAALACDFGHLVARCLFGRNSISGDSTRPSRGRPLASCLLSHEHEHKLVPAAQCGLVDHGDPGLLVPASRRGDAGSGPSWRSSFSRCPRASRHSGRPR